jgi:hypothetical protein
VLQQDEDTEGPILAHFPSSWGEIRFWLYRLYRGFSSNIQHEWTCRH